METDIGRIFLKGTDKEITLPVKWLKYKNEAKIFLSNISCIGPASHKIQRQNPPETDPGIWYCHKQEFQADMTTNHVGLGLFSNKSLAQLLYYLFPQRLPPNFMVTGNNSHFIS